ncbi:hypothetical protein KBY28_05840 [Ruegeria pomeroyi]|uniref:hypothetical protein n=1 Tax=Ruegeria pomeroyi TaxID=89184 RepID=UPI001F469485|nr:hypothetical protein [Ruegeria pomeroyi]MCE8507970.1 hypothetical protein [Ruegeria pomeroyi]
MFRTTLLFAVLAAAPALAQDRAALCHERALKQAGIRHTEWSQGRTTLRLGGSVGVGVSRSSGPATQEAPAYAGSAASERFEEKRRKKIYTRTYDDCMAQTR